MIRDSSAREIRRGCGSTMRVLVVGREAKFGTGGAVDRTRLVRGIDTDGVLLVGFTMAVLAILFYS